MWSDPANRNQHWLLLALSIFTFGFMLGGRALNEPDEGRYAEIAREMLETGDWLVPHIWYVPHLDKPPLAYWAVAASIACFGHNEWAVRLPVALAGLSGVGAAYLLGRRLGGRRAGRWSVLVLQSSLLYFVMARMLTSDIFLSQFIAWAMYFAWRSWRSLDGFVPVQSAAGNRPWRRCLAWQLAAWIAIALGFLTKGPIALIIPAAAWTALAIYRRGESARWRLMRRGAGAGLLLFIVLVAPWFILVFMQVPKAFDYMVAGQFLGHTLGTAIKNRQGSPFYFVAILGVGFLPWTLLLGWLWRPAHWRPLSSTQKEAWLLLSVWVAFTFLTFSFTRAKLPAYILPLFPALSVLVALRWYADGNGPSADPKWTAPGSSGPFVLWPPRWVWRGVMLSPLVLMAALSLTIRFLFKVTDLAWLWPHFAIAVGGLGALLILGRHWDPMRCARWSVVLALTHLAVLSTLAPTVETFLKSNQTLKPLAAQLKAEYRPGDILVCWGYLPQGLPFYLYPTVNAAHPPLLGGISFHQMPFEFPGNRERLGPRVVPDEAALSRLLAGEARVLVVGFQGAFARAQRQTQTVSLRWITQVGRWELFTNR